MSRPRPDLRLIGEKTETHARDGSRTHESLRNWILSPAELATFVPSRSIVFDVDDKKNRDRGRQSRLTLLFDRLE